MDGGTDSRQAVLMWPQEICRTATWKHAAASDVIAKIQGAALLRDACSPIVTRCSGGLLAGTGRRRDSVSWPDSRRPRRHTTPIDSVPITITTCAVLAVVLGGATKLFMGFRSGTRSSSPTISTSLRSSKMSGSRTLLHFPLRQRFPGRSEKQACSRSRPLRL